MYKEYAEVQKQIDVLEEKKDILRKAISSELKEDGVKNEFGNFFWTLKKKWKYSPTVSELEAQVKETKAIEEEKGIATFEETKILTIKVK